MPKFFTHYLQMLTCRKKGGAKRERSVQGKNSVLERVKAVRPHYGVRYAKHDILHSGTPQLKESEDGQKRVHDFTNVYEDLQGSLARSGIQPEDAIDKPAEHKIGDRDFRISHPDPTEGNPDNLVIFFRRFFKPDGKYLKDIMAAYEDVLASGLKPKTVKDLRNPDHHAYHLGIWSGYEWYIFASKDTQHHSSVAHPTKLNGDKCLTAVQAEAVKGLLAALRRAMGGTLYNKLKDVDSETAQRMRTISHDLAKASQVQNLAQRAKDEEKAAAKGSKARVIAHGQVIDDSAARQLKLGLNSMVAVNEGTSSTWHYDSEDDDSFYTVILVTGDGEWGDDEGVMEIPQLGLKLPLKPGDVFMFRSKILLHSVSPITSGAKRVPYTFFVSDRSTSVMRKAWADEEFDHCIGIT
ncbi:hypothetical protein TREMEDRAFT_58277 [Tremella mesenterica DSM 1558]|uniref:uncharacterized protein n=1 Tax=Tremella mesenterica (strain ATCC 24925 / CBS 8224 / DSM 1558 / NBRC 9311 / NRRL Y-6157 / RJB 2259-6 / UBC 559-6) TaxID=578456 RepID=UPI0003F49E10|nr:uncharacterized protein TREMEDRAFT_58277 [Tremella mesenterica DSM 1558]EIW72122.1 hypothetical protein TREMEDRAFT_58277 [Tremella mesenterica DSM 1558]